MTDKPLTDAELNEIEAREKAAMPGPWYANVFVCWFAALNLEMSDADAAFIAHARTDVPRLIAEVRRLWGYEESTEARIATLFDAISHGDNAHRAWLKDKIEEHFK